MMKTRAEKRKFWTQAGVALLLICGAIAVLIRAETKPLGQSELKMAAARLRSLTSAGRQLTEQYLAGQITGPFFETQSSLLQEKAGSERKSLDSADPEKGLELKHWQARHLAKQVGDVLNRIKNKSSELNASRNDLADLFEQLKELEESLKQ
jgi:hypothetical protein